jgi:hypothetical protein
MLGPRAPRLSDCLKFGKQVQIEDIFKGLRVFDFKEHGCSEVMMGSST